MSALPARCGTNAFGVRRHGCDDPVACAIRGLIGQVVDLEGLRYDLAVLEDFADRVRDLADDAPESELREDLRAAVREYL